MAERLAAILNDDSDEARYRALLESIDAAIIVRDADGVARYVNPAAERLFGRPSAEYDGKTIEQMRWNSFYEDGTPISVDELPISVALRTGRVARGRVVGIPQAEGRTLWVTVTAEPVFGDDGGPPQGVILTAIDVTAIKAAADERRVLEQRLAQNARLESLGLLAGGVAHDFNNLLTVILGNAELLGMDTQVDPEALAEIVSAAAQAQAMAVDLLDYIGGRKRNLVPADLNTLCRTVVAQRRAATPAHIRLQESYEPDLPLAACDENQITRVLMNVVLNAVEATKDKPWGAVTLSTGVLAVTANQGTDDDQWPGEPGKYVYVDVEDTGIGMDEATRLRMFDPFFTTKPGGRGLGMAPAIGIVRAHGGRIEVFSVPGEGTRLRLLLPAIDR